MPNHRHLLIILLSLFVSVNVYAAGGGKKVVSNYVSIHPAFVVNIRDGYEVRHMQVKAQLKLSSPEMAKHIDKHKAAIQHEMVTSWDDFLELGAESDHQEALSRYEQRSMEDLATLIYTSGTTGPPKGVMRPGLWLASTSRTMTS